MAGFIAHDPFLLVLIASLYICHVFCQNFVLICGLHECGWYRRSEVLLNHQEAVGIVCNESEREKNACV
jgi:hypothetical protein